MRTTSQRTQAKGLVTAVLLATFLLIATGGAPAHAAANPLLSNQASSSGFPVGIQIYDSAVLGYGLNPTGWLTFRLYSPDDPSCAAAPIFTTYTAVNGNGYYESSRYTTTMAGTYRWIASYGGDANNNPSAATACSDPAGQVAVARRTPLLNAEPSWAPPSASAYAQLTMGAGPSGPTGTMTYRLYGPDNMTCAGAPVFTTTRSVTGNGTYLSSGYEPTVAGTYQWVVIYSGDANNLARGTVCSDTSNGFTVVPAEPTVVSGTPTTVNRGATITVTWADIAVPTAYDWVAIYLAGTPDGGPVTAWRFTTGAADGSTTLKFPWGAVPGSYEVRLMANNSIQRLATSDPITMVW